MTRLRANQLAYTFLNSTGNWGAGAGKIIWKLDIGLPVHAIDAYKCSNCIIKSLRMLDTYVKVKDNTPTGASGDQQHSSTHSGSHIQVFNNAIADKRL